MSKDRHYWSQLRSALTAGLWLSQSPGKTPNGTPISWPELLRKFKKHCKGYADVAQVASQTQALAILLCANSKDEDEDEDGASPLDLGSECMLGDERLDEGQAEYDLLKKLEASSSNLDMINIALAYYAYALGNPSGCIAHLQSVPNILQLQSHIPIASTSNSISATLGVAEAPSLASTAGSFTSLVDSTAAEVKDGRGWAMTETFRSLCLQGMCHERLSPFEPRKALDAYGSAIPLFTTLSSEFSTLSTPKVNGKLDFDTFAQLRELWRWVERLLWRAIILASRINQIDEDETKEGSLLGWLNLYTTCSVSWPSKFRTAHRSTISSLYLRALILRHRNMPNISLPSDKPPAWVHTARSVIQDYRAILSVSTTFPRAGERNIKVEDFVDLCIVVWETSGAIGEHAGWVIDILWWATRLTFNCSRVLRHMTRLLHLNGDTPLAKRTLRLYVQVVGKAYQASKEGVGEDTDTDDFWVETLIFGATMLCRSVAVHPGFEGIDEVREAGVLLEKARTRLNKNNKRLVAGVELAEGIVNSVLGLKEQDPYTRPKRFATAQSCFLASVETNSTPEGHYYLAISYSRPGPAQDLEKSIQFASLAVEEGVSEVRYWHLLGLLLSATEKWKQAAAVLDHGADLDDAGPDEPEQDDAKTIHAVQEEEPNPMQSFSVSDGESDIATPKAQENGWATHSLGSNNGSPAKALSEIPSPSYVLEESATEIPPASTMLRPSFSNPRLAKYEAFEASLQLRMTQAALTEVTEGPEGAETKWVEIFAWIADKKAHGHDLPRPSTDESHFADMNNMHSDIGHAIDEEKVSTGPHTNSQHSAESNSVDVKSPIPITISPASPDPDTRFDDLIEQQEKKAPEGSRTRSASFDRDTSKSKKVQQMLKNRVHKGQAKFTAVSRKIGHGVVRNGPLRRSNSSPDFHAVLRQTTYQASSIHSRKRLSSLIHLHDRPAESSPPPPPPSLPPVTDVKKNSRVAKENRLLSDIWLMSAATFRRLGKIEQAKGAIQEAEVRDENNAAVWVQLALYYVAVNQRQQAIDTFQKALFICPDDVAATVHLSRLYLSPERTKKGHPDVVDQSNVDLASGMLAYLTKGKGWDVPEAWYYLAKAYRLQGRKDREREALDNALQLSENRCVRDLGTAIGWCL